VTSPDPDIVEFGRKAETLIQALADCSEEPTRLIRKFLSPEHRRAADLVQAWMSDAGMTVTQDALATLRGHYNPSNASKLVLCGSHIDTVIDAGRYDGNFGVVAGILAVDEIRRRGIDLPFGLEILAFGDEEGVRFPTTLGSSSAIAGLVNDEVLSLVDDDGISMRQALMEFGADPSAFRNIVYRPEDLLAYLEVHIEQGPVLEAQGYPVGVVTSIAGHARHMITVKGVAGHAGTVPMTLRRDALTAASKIILDIEQLARDNQAHAMVATIGRLELLPGASNVIPNEVTFSVDLRAASDAPRIAATAEIERICAQIEANRGVQVTLAQDHAGDTTACSEPIQDHIAGAISDIGLTPFRLPSGAGHDGQSLAKITDIGMIFVRCRDGISHNPAEHASMDDMGYAVAALVGTLERMGRHYSASS